MRAVEAMDMDTITSLLEAGVDPNIEVYKTLHVYRNLAFRVEARASFFYTTFVIWPVNKASLYLQHALWTPIPHMHDIEHYLEVLLCTTSKYKACYELVQLLNMLLLHML